MGSSYSRDNEETIEKSSVRLVISDIVVISHTVCSIPKKSLKILMILKSMRMRTILLSIMMKNNAQ